MSAAPSSATQDLLPWSAGMWSAGEERWFLGSARSCEEALSWCAGVQILVLLLALAGSLFPDLRPVSAPIAPVALVEELIPLTDFLPEPATSIVSEPGTATDPISSAAAPLTAEFIPFEEPAPPEPVALLADFVEIRTFEPLHADAILEVVAPPPVVASPSPRPDAATSEARAPRPITPATGNPGAVASPNAAADTGSGTPSLFTQVGSGRFPLPPYPQEARARGWQGRVMVRVEVGQDGRPGTPTVESSSGHALLDRAASDWIRKRWRWDAGAPRHLLIPIVFRLQ